MKNSNKKHMFVVCAYKESKYLEECIISLENQVINSEIIVVTSTPNDYISDICNKHNLTLFVNNGEGGIAQDWNFGMKQCKGASYITIAHQDDTYEPQYSKKIIEAIEKQSKPLVAFSDYGEIRNGKIVDDSKLASVKRMMLSPMKNGRFANSKFVRRRILGMGNAICCPAVTYCIDNLDLPVFNVGLKSNLDWETWESLSRKEGAFVYVSNILMHHRIHEESTTSELINANERGDEDYKVFVKFWPRWIARILTRIYSNGEKYNNVN